MILQGTVQLLGKVATPWTDKEGNPHMSYKGHIGQRNLEIVESIKLTKEQYESVQAGKSYELLTEYGISKNGAGYLRITNITEKR